MQEDQPQVHFEALIQPAELEDKVISVVLPTFLVCYFGNILCGS